MPRCLTSWCCSRRTRDPAFASGPAERPIASGSSGGDRLILGPADHPAFTRGDIDDGRVRHGPRAARSAQPADAVLRGDPAVLAPGLHGLQPHVLPDPVRHVRGGVRRAAQRRHDLGRGRRAVPGDRWARRVPVRPAAHAARPLEVRRRPGEVRPHLRLRRRDRQRPGHDPDGRHRLLVRAGELGRPAVRARPEERLPVARRHHSRGRRRPAPGPGAAVEGPAASALSATRSWTSSTTGGGAPISAASTV